MSKTGRRPAKEIFIMPIGLLFTVIGITFFKETPTAKYICLGCGVIILLIAIGMMTRQILQNKPRE